MQALFRLVRAVARLGLALSALAMLVSLALIVYAVFQRYVLGAPVPWTDELVGYLLVAMVMLAAADALLEGEHISVDILTERLGPRGKRVTLLVGLLASAATGVLVLLEGTGMVSFSRMVGLRSNGYLAAPMWVPQLLVPIGGALLVAASIAALWRAWRVPGEALPTHEVKAGIE
jgi:TRAP-type C4-dicarboxylate transport system permease small subunit